MLKILFQRMHPVVTYKGWNHVKRTLFSSRRIQTLPPPYIDCAANGLGGFMSPPVAFPRINLETIINLRFH